jgi:hypothetical protein
MGAMGRYGGAILTVALLFRCAAVVAADVASPIDLSGIWAPRDDEALGDKSLPGDYSGIPINAEGRARADAWSTDTQSMIERQCIMYSGFYTVIPGPEPMKVSSRADPISGKVIAWEMSGAIVHDPRTIWMDGRAAPSKWAQHTAAGFSTGTWEGDTLVVLTTHLAWSQLEHIGIYSSDEASIHEYITRQGDTLRDTMFLYDPVYLSGPYVRSETWVLDPKAHLLPEPCEPAVESTPPGTVPFYLPGENPFITLAAKQYGIPLEGMRGGKETTYPQYQQRLQQLRTAAHRPEK